MGEAKFLYLDFISAKFSYSTARVSFAAMGVEHQNCAIDIRKGLDSYDFAKHGEGEISYLVFIPAKFNYSNKRVSFSAVPKSQ